MFQKFHAYALHSYLMPAVIEGSRSLLRRGRCRYHDTLFVHAQAFLEVLTRGCHRYTASNQQAFLLSTIPLATLLLLGSQNVLSIGRYVLALTVFVIKWTKLASPY